MENQNSLPNENSEKRFIIVVLASERERAKWMNIVCHRRNCHIALAASCFSIRWLNAREYFCMNLFLFPFFLYLPLVLHLMMFSFLLFVLLFPSFSVSSLQKQRPHKVTRTLFFASSSFHLTHFYTECWLGSLFVCLLLSQFSF